MERILVGMDGSETTLWAAIHAVNLAKRINARVSILLVIAPETDRKKKNRREEIEAAARKRVQAIIEESSSEGVMVDYNMSYGSYEGELVRFVAENAITLLVVGLPTLEGKNKPGEFDNFLERIRHRINCRIEVVHEKPL